MTPFKSALVVGVIVAIAVIVVMLPYAKIVGKTDAPLSCSLDAIDTNATKTQVIADCGYPYTENAYSSDGHEMVQFVYDAGTFLWFRDGVLAFYKIDNRHAVEQAKLKHVRRKLVFRWR